MKRNISVILLGLILFVSCDSNHTVFFEDPDNNGLSVFSNKSNNIASAYFGDAIWRTRDRVSSIFSNPSYEIYIHKQVTSSASDTLFIVWYGRLPNQNNQQQVTIYFAKTIPKDFRAIDLVSFKGQRLIADGISSYFKINGYPATPTEKGTGSIYFHMVDIQLNSQADGSGRIAGLFEADFTNLKIKKGRFDHSLSPMHVQLP